MGKRKNRDMSLDRWVILLVVLFVFCGGVIVGWLDQVDKPCLSMDGVDFVMYGVDGHRDHRSDSPALLNALESIQLADAREVPTDAIRHMDVALYDAFRLRGTVLFFYEEGMQHWWVVMNDATREACGSYAVTLVDVLRVFDALRDD